jgi:hypothetical protein
MGAGEGKPMIIDLMSTTPLAPALRDGMRPRAEHGDILGAFLRKRLRLQQGIRALQEAHQQGLALDMAFAAKQMEGAARELSSHLRQLLAQKVRMEMRARGRPYNRASISHKKYIDARADGAMYECRALRELTADLFEMCLRADSLDPLASWPQGRSPAEKYPWLRRSLEGSAAMIDCALAVSDERRTVSLPENVHG